MGSVGVLIGGGLAEPCMRLHFAGQSEPKRCASVLIRRRPQPSAVRLDDLAADRQPHAHAVRLGRIKGIKEMIHSFGLKPETRVLHCDHHTARIVWTGPEEQVSRPIRNRRHRFDAVHE